MNKKPGYPDHPELLDRVLQQISDTPIEEYDARVTRYEQETCATLAAERQLMSPQTAPPEQGIGAGTQVRKVTR
jgi:hypothetical protein